MFALLTIVLLVGSALSYAADSKPYYNVEEVEEHFELFIITYNKTYASEEEKMIRLAIFKENIIKINELNQKPHTTIHAVNHFTDMTTEEFLNKFTGFNYDAGYGTGCDPMDLNGLKQGPDSFDWRTQGGVTPVKSQQHCGSCWAFSATGNVESQYAIKHQQQIDLSEQQLVDCNTESNCKIGGIVDDGLQLLMQEGGQMLESDYPYIAQQSSCKFVAGQAQVRVNSCSRVVTQDEELVKNILYTHGPLSFALNAEALKSYDGSIVQGCLNAQPNHAVLLVGYGSENGIPYWILKNSWDTTWGESGYAKLPRGQNACNMLEFGFTLADVM